MQTVLDIIRHYSGAGKEDKDMITRKQQAEAAAAFNESQMARMRERTLDKQETVTARTEWVWTQEAQRRNPSRQRAGEPVWPQWKTVIPKFNVDQGLVVDKSEFGDTKEGQADLFEYL